MTAPLNFCPHCGAPVEYKIPEGDDRVRRVCTATGRIFYDNPRNVVGTIVEREGRILMCKRAIEPRRAFWTLPAGYLEMGETCSEGAARETREEAGVRVTGTRLFSLIDVTHIGQIHMFFTADMVSDVYRAGPESLEVRFMTEDEINWSQLAFPSIHYTLKHYFADRDNHAFGLHMLSTTPDDWKALALDRHPDETV